MTALADADLGWGRRFEDLTAAWLEAHGWRVTRAHANGFAPMMSGFQKLRVPDLHAIQYARTVWVDAKRKQTHGFYRNWNMKTTGIDRANYLDYLEVREQSGAPVYLVFGHEDVDEVRVVEIGQQPVEMPGHKAYGRQGMVFWPYDNLKLVGRLTDLEARPLSVPDVFPAAVETDTSVQLRMGL